MINELDTVVLTHDLDKHGLKKGDIGAVVHVGPQAKSFEVEFVSGDGTTIAVLTLSEQDIRPVGNQEILHVREMV
ncbi:MAG TPA: DUF4926 domain-containing protein [Gemmataceae bacterium]|jgi:hypothetical protein|nr:DUF4926 domain-containing protein [Gemmataceae bacterium]